MEASLIQTQLTGSGRPLYRILGGKQQGTSAIELNPNFVIKYLQKNVSNMQK